MKLLMSASLLFYSSLSLAGYKCQDQGSSLFINETNPQKVEVKLITQIGRGLQVSMLKGSQLKSETPIYYEMKYYGLEDSKGNMASLKVSIIPRMTRVPPCTGRRVCSNNFQPVDISAELDYQGKVSSYDCQEEII